jgi:hypothetical protein
VKSDVAQRFPKSRKRASSYNVGGEGLDSKAARRPHLLHNTGRRRCAKGHHPSQATQKLSEFPMARKVVLAARRKWVLAILTVTLFEIARSSPEKNKHS